MWKKLKNWFLDILFPRFCFNCKEEGSYLCQDCEALLEISGFHQKYSTQNLKDLYFALNYQNPLVKKLIQRFKDEPFIKELSGTLASLIIAHFQLMDNKPDLSEYILMPVPLNKKRLKWRGFNQSEEIAKHLSLFFKIPLVLNCLIKDEEIFSIKNDDAIKERKIILVDDFYKTGKTMEECAKALKKAGAKEIIGITIARG